MIVKRLVQGEDRAGFVAMALVKAGARFTVDSLPGGAWWRFTVEDDDTAAFLGAAIRAACAVEAADA